MPRPLKYVSRADLGWGRTPAGSANPKSGLVVHYDSVDQGLADKDHDACIAYWNATRRFHTGPSRNWADIGYSWMACPHGHVLEGRGLYRVQAAQPGGNSTHYSVTLATGPNDRITPGQIEAVRQLRAWLMEPDTSISGKVLGHRDFIATSCPGDKAYRMVRDGTFSQPPTWNTAPAPEGEDFLDMAEHRKFRKPKGRPQLLPVGEWKTVELSEGDYSIAFAGETFSATVGLTFEATAPEGVEVRGREIQTRLALYKPNPNAGRPGEPNHIRHTALPIDSPVHDAGLLHATLAWNDVVPKDRRVRVEAVHYIDGAEVRVVDATASVLFSK